MANQHTSSIRLRDRRHIIFYDAHTGEYPGYTCFAEWDPAQIVDVAAQAGADMVFFFSKDHFGNCFCDLPGGHRHKDVPGDYTGQIVAELRRRGIGVGIYYSVFADRFAGMQHPDWQVHNAEYEARREQGFPWLTLCHNSPFTDEVFIPHMRTIVERYRPDALFWDAMSHGGLCTCAGCQKNYREMFGRALDVQHVTENPREWTTFFMKTWNAAIRRALEACTRILPEVEITIIPRRDNPDLAREIEPYVALDGTETNLNYVNANMGMMTPGMKARSMRTRRMTGYILMNAFNGCWGEATVKNATLLTAECAAIYANGIRVVTAEYIRTWGKAEPEGLKVIAKALADEKVFEGLSIDIPAPRHIAVLDNHGETSNHHVCGASKLLMEEHQQFDIMDETGLDDLAGYRLLWASPINLWKQERWETVLRWVRDGGVLLLEASEELGKSAGLQAILKAADIRNVEPSPFSATYFLPENEFVDSRHVTMSIMLHEPSWRFETSRGQRLVDMADPIAQWDPKNGIVFRTNVLHPNRDTRRAGIVESAVGKGSVIFLPASIARGYYEHNYSPLRRLIMNLIKRKKAAPFEVDVPPYVEANMLCRPGKASILHLVQYCLNHSGANGDGLWAGERYHDIEDTRPLFEVPVRIRCEKTPRVVTAYPGKLELKWEFIAGWCRTVLPRLDLHAAIEVTY